MAYDWANFGTDLQKGITSFSNVATQVTGARTALENLKNSKIHGQQMALMNQAQIDAQNLQNAQAAQNLAAQQAAALNPKQPAGGMSTTTMLMIGGGLVAVLGLFWVLKK